MIAAAAPTGRAFRGVSGSGGCAVITAIIHHPQIARNSSIYYFAQGPGPRRDTPGNPQIKRRNYRPDTDSISGVLGSRVSRTYSGEQQAKTWDLMARLLVASLSAPEIAERRHGKETKRPGSCVTVGSSERARFHSAAADQMLSTQIELWWWRS